MHDQAHDDSHAALREALYKRLRGRPSPLLSANGAITPAASLWSTTRVWTRRFREIGLEAGDRVVLALPPGAAFLGALLAGLWEGIGVCVVEPDADLRAEAMAVDAALVVSGRGDAGTSRLGVGVAAMPLDGPVARRPDTTIEPGVALVLRTSGTSGQPKRIALSYANIWAHLSTHMQAFELDEHDVVLSVAPWHHAFGLLVDALPALLSGAAVVVDPTAARHPGRVRDALHGLEATWLSAVPQVVRGLLHQDGGSEAVARLRGGVVGGAVVTADLAECLRGTRLRAGYGQTEAGPGITLGSPGGWAPGMLGEPLGCETWVDGTGHLRVRGPNVHLGRFIDGRLERLPRDRWLETGDLVSRSGANLIFRGRVDHRFKLENGRMVDAPHLERLIEEQIGGEVALRSPDSRRLVVTVCGPTEPSATAIRRAVERVLGGLAPRLEPIVVLRSAEAVRTRKGDLDRQALPTMGLAAA